MYCGPAALSENETQAIKSLFDKARPQFDALVTYHSYGQKILYPWASETYTGGNQLIDSLIASQDTAGLRREIAAALGDASKLDPKIRARTEEANLRRLVRERFNLPRLTLF